MRTQASRTLFCAFILGCLLFAPAAMAIQDGDPVDPVGEEEETVFTDGEGVDEDGDGIIDPPPAGQVYCVYRISQITQGNCGAFKSGDRLCVDCPDTGKCPVPAGQLGHFRYVDAFGNTICQGEWWRRFDDTQPDACLLCGNGKTGYKFVN